MNQNFSSSDFLASVRCFVPNVIKCEQKAYFEIATFDCNFNDALARAFIKYAGRSARFANSGGKLSIKAKNVDKIVHTLSLLSDNEVLLCLAFRDQILRLPSKASDLPRWWSSLFLPEDYVKIENPMHLTRFKHLVAYRDYVLFGHRVFLKIAWDDRGSVYCDGSGSTIFINVTDIRS